MASHAWVLGVEPGHEEELRRRHDAPWPEMDARLREPMADIRRVHLDPRTGVPFLPKQWSLD